MEFQVGDTVEVCVGCESSPRYGTVAWVCPPGLLLQETRVQNEKLLYRSMLDAGIPRNVAKLAAKKTGFATTRRGIIIKRVLHPEKSSVTTQYFTPWRANVKKVTP